MPVMQLTHEEVVAAHEAAKDTLITTDVENNNQGEPRMVVRDLKQDGKIIKRFRPSDTGSEVRVWMNNKWPDGVYISSGDFFKKKLLRIGRLNRLVMPESVEESLRAVADNAVSVPQIPPGMG